MCGIIGILNSENVSQTIYGGLLSLQHRGQDSAGIVTHNGEKVFVKKNTGLVTQAISASDLDMLSGDMGIGHVRYTTAGASDLQNAQPFVITYPFGVAMASNGNTINYPELKKYLKDKGHVELTSKCDLEAILGLFIHELTEEMGESQDIEAKHIFKVAEKVMTLVKGSYSLVGLVGKHGIVAMRDPLGIKPLSFGKKNSKKGTSYIFASETVALDTLGYDFIRDVEPGEVIFIESKTKALHTKKIVHAKHAHCMFEWIYFARPDSTINERGVCEARLNLGRELAKLWDKKNIDSVIPTPDTSRTAALTFAEATGIKYREGLIKNRYVARTFIMPKQSLRADAVKNKLNAIRSEVNEKRLALVDDSIVRGTTSKKIIKLLRKAGAEEVHMLSSCPPITSPCIYGIDMPTKDELVAGNRTVEEVRKELNADTLTYQTAEGIKKAIGCSDLCMACLNGEYPIEGSKDVIEKMGGVRKKERGETTDSKL